MIFDISVADPGFPRRGAANFQGGDANLLFNQIFPKNCMEMKEFGPRRGARPWRPPSLDLPLDLLYSNSLGRVEIQNVIYHDNRICHHKFDSHRGYHNHQNWHFANCVYSHIFAVCLLWFLEYFKGIHF